jgi:hypothetical protein
VPSDEVGAARLLIVLPRTRNRGSPPQRSTGRHVHQRVTWASDKVLARSAAPPTPAAARHAPVAITAADSTHLVSITLPSAVNPGKAYSWPARGAMAPRLLALLSSGWELEVAVSAVRSPQDSGRAGFARIRWRRDCDRQSPFRFLYTHAKIVSSGTSPAAPVAPRVA